MNNEITTANHSDPDYQAYSLLKVAFIVAPLVAGLDKFFNYLTDWTNYLAPIFPEMLNVSATTFMMGIGVVEIIAGIGVALKPKIFGYVVSAWLVGIILNLFMVGNYYDVALRDLGLAIGSFALARLAVRFDVPHTKATLIERRHVLKQSH